MFAVNSVKTYPRIFFSPFYNLKFYTAKSLKYQFFLFLLLFIYSSHCLAQNDPESIDVSLFRTINNGRSKVLDRLTDFNDNIVAPSAVVVPVAFFLYGYASNRQYVEDTSVLLAVSEALSFSFEQGLKRIVKRERPFLTLQNVHVDHLEPAHSYSFPSGHSAIAFALATTLSLRYPEPYVYFPLHAWAFFVGYGRIYLGQHYPSDVLAGAVIGSGFSILIYTFRDEIIGLKNRILGRSSKEGKEETHLKGIDFAIFPTEGGFVLRLQYDF